MKDGSAISLRWLLARLGVCIAILAGYSAAIRWLGTPIGLRSPAAPLWAWWTVPPFFENPLRALLLLPPLLLLFAGRLLMRLKRGEAVFIISAILFSFAFNLAVCMISATPSEKGFFYEIGRPFDFKGVEFYGDAHLVRSTGQFLHDYVSLRGQSAFSLHACTHPPGPVLFFHYIERLIGPGLIRAALVAVGMASLSLLPAFLLARRLYGPRVARMAVCLLAVTPSFVVHGATSMDAVYVLPMIAALWLYFEACAARSPSLVAGVSVLMGLLLVICAMLTFATSCLGVLMGVHALLVTWRSPREVRQPWVVLAIGAAVFALSYLLIYFATGYNVIACLRISMKSDTDLMGASGGGSLGRYLDFTGANLVAFLIGCGFALTLLLCFQLRQSARHWASQRTIDPFVWTFAITLLFMAASTLFRLETERIWIFMIPLAAIAAAQWIEQRGAGKVFGFAMTSQAVQTVLMQCWLYTLW